MEPEIVDLPEVKSPTEDFQELAGAMSLVSMSLRLSSGEQQVFEVISMAGKILVVAAQEMLGDPELSAMALRQATEACVYAAHMKHIQSGDTKSRKLFKEAYEEVSTKAEKITANLLAKAESAPG